MFRNICALIAALLLAASCGQALAGAQPVQEADVAQTAVGAWQLAGYAFDGNEYSRQDLDFMAETFTLHADGTAAHSLYGETEEGVWRAEDGGVTLETPTVVYRLTFDGDTLVCDDGLSRLIFVRATDSLAELYFDTAQAQAMCNLMNGGMFAIAGDSLIGLNWDAEGRAMLAMRPLTGGAEVAGDAVMLDGSCRASFINASGDAIYYLRAGLEGDSGIYALDADGTDRRLLREGAYGSLQLCDGRLYYTDADNALFSCAPDGDDERRETQRAVRSPYLLSREWLLYADAADGALHVLRLTDGYDVALNATRSALPVLVGSELYYFELPYDRDDERADMAHICRLDMLTLSAERAAGFCGAYLAVTAEGLCAAEGQRLANAEAWWAIENEAYRGPSQVPVFSQGDYLVSLLYEDGAAVRMQLERLSDHRAVSFNE